MKIYATYCSADKSSAPGEIPASNAIQAVVFVGKQTCPKAWRPFIVSGKYGLIKAEEEIAYYDYLLTSDVLNEHLQLLSQQLSKLEFNK